MAVAMNKIMQYSKGKFSGFSDGKKLGIIASFIDAVDRITDEKDEERLRLLSELEKCLSFLKDSANMELAHWADRLGKLKELPPEKFRQTVSLFLEKHGRELRDHDLLPVQREETKSKFSSSELPLRAIFHNLRSAFNVGAMIRTSECFGIHKVYMTGYTPTPENSKVKKTSMATTENILWEREEDIIILLDDLHRKKIELVALETVEFAEPLQKSRITKPAAIIVGNEAHGLPQEVLDKADKVLEIPLFGMKESLNVGVAYAIACYEIFRQWKIID
jgi:tRNA G18 (ribose-2'-O)-methylase SpoU